MNFKEGDIRNFRFKENPHKIEEIIDSIDYNIDITWDTGICPHCKQRITKTITHKINKIEILVDNTIKDKIKLKDIVVLGYSIDNRILLIEKKYLKEIFEMSKLFKEYVSEVI